MLEFRVFLIIGKFKVQKNATSKKIGNAIPVNMAKAIGHSLIRLLNDIEKSDQTAIHSNIMNQP